MNVRSIPSRRLKREREVRVVVSPRLPITRGGVGWLREPSAPPSQAGAAERGGRRTHTHTQQSSRKGTNPGSSGSVDNSVCECVSVFMSSLSPLSAYMAQKSHHNILLSSFVFH